MAAGSEWEAGPGPGPGPEPGPIVGGGRSGGVTAVGVLGIVIGAIELLGCGLLAIGGAAFMGLGKAAQEKALEGVPQADKEAIGGFLGFILGILVVYGLVGIILGVLRLVSGIGILQRRRWGRTMTLVVAAITIPWALVAIIWQIFGILFIAMYLTYAIMAFVLLLNARNALEFR
jgi:uncharacterized membrane protein (DUF2068 family)